MRGPSPARVLPAVAGALLIAVAVPRAFSAEVNVQVTQERPDGYRAEIVIRNPGERRVTDWSLEFSTDRVIERAWGAEMSRTGASRYRFRPDPWTREIGAGGQAKFTVAGPPADAPLQPAELKLDARYAESAAAATPAGPDRQDLQAEKKPAAASGKPAAASGKPAAASGKPAAASGKEEKAGLPSLRAASGARSSREAADARSAVAVDHTLAFKLQSSWDSGFTAEVAVINGTVHKLRPWRLEFQLEGDIVEMWNADYRKVGGNGYVITPKAYNDEIDPGGFVTFGFKTSTAFSARPNHSRLSTVN